MGIDDVRDSVPPVPAGATPGDDPEQEARISDVPFVGDGFHAGGCRLYDQHPEIVAARSRAYKKSQEQPDVFSRFFGWFADKVLLTDRIRLPKFLARIIKKMTGNDNEPPSAPLGGSGITTGTRSAASTEPPVPNVAKSQALYQQMQSRQAIAAGGPASLFSLNVFFRPAFMCQWQNIAIVNPVFLCPVKVF